VVRVPQIAGLGHSEMPVFAQVIDQFFGGRADAATDDRL